MSGVTNVGKNMDNELRLTVLSGKGKKDLIVQFLV